MAQAELDFESIRQTDDRNVAVKRRTVTARTAQARTSTTSTMLLSVMDVAHLLGCGRTFVYELIGAGELKTVKLGRLRRVPTDAVESLISRLRSESGADSRP